MVILAGIIKVFREMRSGAYDDQQLEEQLNRRGLMNRFMGLWPAGSIPLEDAPVGFLFGLGLDTAIEAALVGAGQALPWSAGCRFYAVLSLPTLFAAGMSLFDTADGVS